jgi:AraC-like DNA-binding protein
VYPRFATRTEADGEGALHPDGWEIRHYTIRPGAVRFTKHILSLGEDLVLEEDHLHAGSIRVDGAISEGRLQIALLQLENHRVFGSAADGGLQVVSCNGSAWDAAGGAPASALTFNATESLVGKIVSRSAVELLKSRFPSDGENWPLITSFTSQSGALEALIRGSIQRAREGAFGPDEQQRLRDDLSTVVGALIAEIAHVARVETDRPTKSHYFLARAVEKALWTGPITAGDRINLDLLASRFLCSRRYIQLAVSKTFGLSFTALKRCVRLHQARRALHETTLSITDVALRHEFEHLGRFAAYYKEFFGVLPGLERSGVRLNARSAGPVSD